MRAFGNGSGKVFVGNACDVLEEFGSGGVCGLWTVKNLWCIPNGTCDLTGIKVKMICEVGSRGSGKLTKVGNLSDTRIAG